MNSFCFLMFLTFSSIGLVVSRRQKNHFQKNPKVSDVPEILWKLYDVLSTYSSCKDMKIFSISAKVRIRGQKIYTRAEIPPPVKSKFVEAQLRLEFRDTSSNTTAFLADIVPKDSRMQGAFSQEPLDVIVDESGIEMSFDVTGLLRPDLQLRRRHFSAHLELLSGLPSAGSLKVFLIVQQRDTTCSKFSVPQRGLDALPYSPLNVSGDHQCRLRSHRVPARRVPVSFTVRRPLRIDIGNCEGRCELVQPRRSFFSDHSVMKAYLEMAGGARNWFSPCCVPSAYKPVLIMGQEPFSNFVSILEVPNLVISSCACM